MERFQGKYIGTNDDGEKQFLIIDTKTGTFYGKHGEKTCNHLFTLLNSMDEEIKELKKQLKEKGE